MSSTCSNWSAVSAVIASLPLAILFTTYWSVHRSASAEVTPRKGNAGLIGVCLTVGTRRGCLAVVPLGARLVVGDV